MISSFSTGLPALNITVATILIASANMLIPQTRILQYQSQKLLGVIAAEIINGSRIPLTPTILGVSNSSTEITIVFCVKGIYGVQQTGKVIVDASSPDKGITVGIGFYFVPSMKSSFRMTKPSFFRRRRNW